mgnify:CR=1 FL=1
MKNNIDKEPLSGALTEPFNATPQEMEQIKAAIKKHQDNELLSGALTVPMDFDSEEYKAHRKILDERINSMSPEEKRQVELIRMEYKIKNYLDAEVAEDEIIIVGEFIKMYLDKINVKQDEFAKHIGISLSNFREILSGQHNINPKLSVILGQLFQIDPKVWVQIQLKNDYILIEKTKNEYKEKNVRYAMTV